MRVWLACFVVLFALAEFFDWLQAFTLPLPIYILGGAFLAVASNYDKILGSYFSDASLAEPNRQTQLDLPSQCTDSTALTIANSTENSQAAEIQ